MQRTQAFIPILVLMLTTIAQPAKTQCITFKDSPDARMLTAPLKHLAPFANGYCKTPILRLGYSKPGHVPMAGDLVAHLQLLPDAQRREAMARWDAMASPQETRISGVGTIYYIPMTGNKVFVPDPAFVEPDGSIKSGYFVCLP
jgi:hypothetical protein